jgi:hypothetical protein
MVLVSARARNSAAVSPRVVSMRMSSGASARKLKPREASSICGELTPRSSSTPCTEPMPRAASSAAMSPKLAWQMAKRGSSMRAASASAAGSLSKATSRPCGARRCSTARLWPPRPKVPST